MQQSSYLFDWYRCARVENKNSWPIINVRNLTCAIPSLSSAVTFLGSVSGLKRYATLKYPRYISLHECISGNVNSWSGHRINGSVINKNQIKYVIDPRRWQSKDRSTLYLMSILIICLFQSLVFLRTVVLNPIISILCFVWCGFKLKT